MVFLSWLALLTRIGLPNTLIMFRTLMACTAASSMLIWSDNFDKNGCLFQYLAPCILCPASAVRHAYFTEAKAMSTLQNGWAAIGLKQGGLSLL